MATHRADVSVCFGVPDALEAAVAAAELPLVRVPDVRMCSEAKAIARFTAAGLVPGLRAPRPRPVNGRPEVVIRTHPRHGTAVRRGTRIDYELLPGEPVERAGTQDYTDFDSVSSLDVTGQPSSAWSPADRSRYIDYDIIDTLARSDLRPVEVRA